MIVACSAIFQPGFSLMGTKWLKIWGGGAVHASITHDGGKAVAFVIIEKAGGDR